jgi:glycosyltransferase involved in cell wall biosynthesis
VVGSAARLFNPGDASELSDVLAELLEDVAARRRLTDAGLRHARTFTWTGTARAMREAWHLAHEDRVARGRA